jgi:hypothetical protein
VKVDGWNIHRGFGLRLGWIELYYQKPEEWDGILGNRQVESVRVWLKTAGLADGPGRKTLLAEKLLERGFKDTGCWELIWVNMVFNWPTAAWYVKEMRKGRWTTRELADSLQNSAGRLAPRTSSNAIQELAGLLQYTPAGSVLGQGEVTDTRPRMVERKGCPSPSEEAVRYALSRLFAAERRSNLRFDENLLWPWVVFGCSRQEALELLGAKEAGELFEVTGKGLILKTPAGEG